MTMKDRIEDLCPYHDLGNDLAECAGPWTCNCGEVNDCGSPCLPCTTRAANDPTQGFDPEVFWKLTALPPLEAQRVMEEWRAEEDGRLERWGK